MLFDAEKLIFVPVSVLLATAVIAMIVTLLVDMSERRAAVVRGQPVRPVLVHDSAREKLLRSAANARVSRRNRAAAARIRLVYPAGV